MKLLHGKTAYVVAGVAAAVALGTATAVAQPAGQQTSATKVSEATAAVAQHSDRYGFGPGQALNARQVMTDKTGATIRFDRTYRGLPVIGGDFVVHLSPSGAYQFGFGRHVVGLPSNVNPSVTATAAKQAVLAGIHYRVAKAETELVVFTRVHSSELAWQVTTSSPAGAHADKSYVSAMTGGTLASYPLVMTDSLAKKDTGKGKTIYSGTVKLNDVKNKKGNKYKLVDKLRGDQEIYDAHNSEITAGTLYVDKNNVWGNHKDTSRESAGADAAFSLANTWDFYLKTFDRDGIADNGVAARAFVHVYSGWVNASWSDSCFCMRFGDGSQASGTGSLVALDVGGHEMSHGVTSRTAGLNYAGESGGLNESTSDVMGSMVEFFANNKHDVADYVIGEEIFRDYDPATNYIRRMDDPNMDGLSANCWYNGVGNLNVHYSSGVGNHLFYLLSEGSGSKTINGIKYDSPTCNSKSVRGIGHDKAAAIWYRALTHYWVSTTSYHDARVGMLQAAKDLYGKASKEYKATDKAWAAVNVTP